MCKSNTFSIQAHIMSFGHALFTSFQLAQGILQPSLANKRFRKRSVVIFLHKNNVQDAWFQAGCKLGTTRQKNPVCLSLCSDPNRCLSWHFHHLYSMTCYFIWSSHPKWTLVTLQCRFLCFQWPTPASGYNVIAFNWYKVTTIIWLAYLKILHL